MALRDRVPGPLEPVARRVVRVARGVERRTGLRRRVRRVRWGNLRRTSPVSARYGFDRGTPIDRPMLDDFFARHADAIRGRVLEVADPGFSERFGTAVTSMDVLDIDPANDRATVIADLADEGSLPPSRFDCIVLPQTLQYVEDLGAACRNLWQALAPGGALLVTVPTVAKLDHHLREVDRWRLTPSGLRTLLESSCPGAGVTVEGRGNVLAAVAYLMGVSTEELRADELATNDVDFPLLALACVRRPA